MLLLEQQSLESRRGFMPGGFFCGAMNSGNAPGQQGSSESRTEDVQGVATWRVTRR